MNQASQAANYCIFIKGTIDPRWLDSLSGLTITKQSQPDQAIITRLEGRLEDQSALHGVLETLFMLNMRLISLERLETIGEIKDIHQHN